MYLEWNLKHNFVLNFPKQISFEIHQSGISVKNQNSKSVVEIRTISQTISSCQFNVQLILNGYSCFPTNSKKISTY